MAGTSNESGVTNYKKLFDKHVHEQFFLKKHMSRIDCEMRQRNKEISGDQAKFLEKYKKFMNVRKNNHPDNINNNYLRRRSCSDISEMQENRKKALISTAAERSFKSQKLLSQRIKSAVERKIRKNSMVEPPIDFPYSFPIWNARVDNGSFEDNGCNPRDTRRDSFLQSLEGLTSGTVSDSTELDNPNTETPQKSQVFRKASTDCERIDINQINSNKVNGSDLYQHFGKDKNGNDNYENIKLPEIRDDGCFARHRSKTRNSTELVSRKVHFSIDTKIMDIENIDLNMQKERRKSFSEFKF